MVMLFKQNLQYFKVMIQGTMEEQLSPALLKEIQENKKSYEKNTQLALYASLQHIEQMAIFTKSSCDVQCNVVFCFNATQYDPQKKDDITTYIIRTLNDEMPKLKNKFSVAYVHESISTFLYLRNVLHMLPANQFSRLQHFYIVHAGLIVKILEKLSFGAINNFLLERTEHFSSPEDIEAKHKILLGGNVTKSKLKMMKDPQPQNPQITHEADPSVNAIIRKKFYGKQLGEYELSPNGIPLLIQILITRLYSNTNFLQAEGIMRKSCDVQQLQILEDRIQDDPYYPKFIAKYDSPYVLCGCLKKIISNLYSPLFSYELYDTIVQYRSDGHEENDKYFAKTCIQKMQKLNRGLFLYLIAFLKKGIVTYEEVNKMSAYNLAVVFGPCFFRPKEYRVQDLMYSPKLSSIILLVLKNFEEIMGEEAFTFYALLEKQKSIFKQNQ